MKTDRYILIFLFCCSSALASTFVNVDMDLRADKNDAEIHGLGISLRHVLADDTGDRYIFFGLLDSKHDFEETMLDQCYAQYKGGLGRWNLLLGRFIVPFGLLTGYSSTRSLIDTMEMDTIGLETDNGMMLSGIINGIEYSASISNGEGMERISNRDDKWMAASRIGYQGLDIEDISYGISFCSGKINYESERKLFALDATKYISSFILRGETAWGTRDGDSIGSIFAQADYALLPKLDISLGYNFLHENNMGDMKILYCLAEYEYRGFQFRACQKTGDSDEYIFQIYKSYSFNN